MGIEKCNTSGGKSKNSAILEEVKNLPKLEDAKNNVIYRDIDNNLWIMTEDGWQQVNKDEKRHNPAQIMGKNGINVVASGTDNQQFVIDGQTLLNEIKQANGKMDLENPMFLRDEDGHTRVFFGYDHESSGLMLTCSDTEDFREIENDAIVLSLDDQSSKFGVTKNGFGVLATSGIARGSEEGARIDLVSLSGYFRSKSTIEMTAKKTEVILEHNPSQNKFQLTLQDNPQIKSSKNVLKAWQNYLNIEELSQKVQAAKANADKALEQANKLAYVDVDETDGTQSWNFKDGLVIEANDYTFKLGDEYIKINGSDSKIESSAGIKAMFQEWLGITND